ncbi:stage II sporulation protein R [uncultured Tyzzerella sp.]|uniref:stage II sporulation protein R n=1 Tax=uncultured Tyzzerella sp. TaxID=2321398 RepID=UPI0029422DC3|nr:stage II sporulation protein R [uncultured Tyzzerella sp.]
MNILKREKNILLLSIFIGTFITMVFMLFTKSYSYNIQKGIADEVIRLHVLANSDEDYDQQLKIKVKDGIVKMLENQLHSSMSKDETRIILLQNLDKIEKKAKEIIIENGYSYDVNAKISFDNFPTKQYGDVVLPAGEYEALKVEIGNAKGKNWWCVMFPPLCFVDASVKEVPKEDKELLKSILTDTEYDIVTKAEDKNNIPIKIKFKIIEMWQK